MAEESTPSPQGLNYGFRHSTRIQVPSHNLPNYCEMVKTRERKEERRIIPTIILQSGVRNAPETQVPGGGLGRTSGMSKRKAISGAQKLPGGGADPASGRQQDRAFEGSRGWLSPFLPAVGPAPLRAGLGEAEASPKPALTPKPSAFLTLLMGALPPPAPTWSHIPPGKVCRVRREGGAATWGPS